MSNVKIFINNESSLISTCGCGYNPCNCNSLTYTNSQPSSNSPCVDCDSCVDLLDTKCVIYNGDDISGVDITTASTLLVVIQKLASEIIALKSRVTALEA